VSDAHILIQAAKAGSEITIKSLLERFPDMDLEMRRGMETETPLLHAASSGNLASTKLLLAAGASIDAVYKSGNIVHSAITAPSLDILKFLATQNVDWQARGQLTLEEDGNFLLRDATPLHRAAAHCNSGFLDFFWSIASNKTQTFLPLVKKFTRFIYQR